MKLSELSLTGISEAFPERVSVNFGALGPGLIALVGENGVGKSTLIGCVFAALFRQLPGQKRSLYDFCTHPKPEIDLAFSVGGVTYRALHKINPQARQMESYLFDGQGRPLTSGKKEAFQEEITRRVGTAQLFLASYFSAQKRTGNFLGLERSERKQLFITELLGLDRLRRISAAAGEGGRRMEPESPGLGRRTQRHMSTSSASSVRRSFPVCHARPSTCWTVFWKNDTVLRFREHSTDTHGYMEDVFGLCYLLGFSFIPRIRDLADQQLYRIDRDATYPNLSGIFRGGVDVGLIREQWDQLVRVAASLKNRICPAHIIIQRLAHRSPADRLAKALTHLGRVVKTIYILKVSERRRFKASGATPVESG